MPSDENRKNGYFGKSFTEGQNEDEAGLNRFVLYLALAAAGLCSTTVVLYAILGQ